MLKKIIGFLLVIALLCTGAFMVYWTLIRQTEFPVFIEALSHGTVTVDGYEKTGEDNSFRILVKRGDSITLNISPENTDSTAYELDRLVVNGENVTKSVAFLKYETVVERKLSILAYFKPSKNTSAGQKANSAKLNRIKVEEPNEVNAYLGSVGAYGLKDPSIVYDGLSDRFYCFASGNRVSSSRDFVNWTSLGGYFDVSDKESEDKTTMSFESFPSVKKWAKAHGYSSDAKVSDAENNRTPLAPDVVKVGGTYYLYFSLCKRDGQNEAAIFCVKTTNLEQAITTHTWEDVGLVLNTCCTSDGTSERDSACATHPSVFIGADNKLYMAYGSYFGDEGNVSGAVYLTELDSATGLVKKTSELSKQGDKIGAVHGSASFKTGKLIAKPGRAPSLSKKEGSLISGADIAYNADKGFYYMVVTYGTQGKNESIRIARSKKVEGPYVDFMGNDMASFQTNSTDQYDVGMKVLGGYSFTGSYTGGVSVNDLGRASTGSASLIKTGSGWYYAMHSGAYVPTEDGQLTLGGERGTEPALDIRRVIWSNDNWPLVSSEPYAGERPTAVTLDNMAGIWDVVVFNNREAVSSRDEVENNKSFKVSVFEGKAISQKNIDKKTRLDELSFVSAGNGAFTALIDSVSYTLYTSVAYDSELGQNCHVFAGYDSKGTVIFGKKSIAVNSGLYTDTFYYAAGLVDSKTADSYKEKLNKLGNNPTQADINSLTVQLLKKAIKDQ